MNMLTRLFIIVLPFMAAAESSNPESFQTLYLSEVAGEIVSSELSVKLIKSRDELAVELRLTQVPGVAIDVIAVDVTAKGDLLYFPFVDSFGTRGFGIIRMREGVPFWIDLTVVPCPGNDSRSARQYGEFWLKEDK